VDLHAVGELEGLEVSVGQDGGTGTKVLDLGEFGHELGPGDAALLVDQLDGGPLAVVSHAVTHQHVKLLLVVLDGENHGHGLSDLDKAADLGGPGTLADLDLHPAANIVAGEISTNNVKHVHGEGSECDRLLVLIMPCTSELPGLVPNLLDLGIVLDNDGVLEVSAGAGVSAVAVQTVLGVTGCAAGVDGHVELSLAASEGCGQVHALGVAVESLAEDDTIERFVKLDGDLHEILLALDVEAGDLGHIGLGLGPRVVGLGGLDVAGHRLGGLRSRGRSIHLLRRRLLHHGSGLLDVLLLGRLLVVSRLGWSIGRLGLVLGRRPWAVVGRLGLRLRLRLGPVLGRRRTLLGLGSGCRGLLGGPVRLRRRRLVLRLLLGRRSVVDWFLLRRRTVIGRFLWQNDGSRADGDG